MLRKIRIVAAAIFFIGVTLLFLDFTGTAHLWLGWMARIQFVPALLALNVGVVAGLILLTLVCGRIYCSVVCPMGVFQDIVARLSRRGSPVRKLRYSYSKPMTWLRVTMLVIFTMLCVAGLASVAALIEPYSAYGRMAQNVLGPVYAAVNNVFASVAESLDSYAVYETDVWVRSWGVFVVSVATFVIIGLLAWRNGRTWCNTVCPVGTLLGYVAKWSWLRPVIDTDKCNNCGLCSRRCKASCIDGSTHSIDLTRCVACMDCVDSCTHGAISYTTKRRGAAAQLPDRGRRGFMAVTALAAGAALADAQKKTTDGGLAVILDKKAPRRATPVVPPGAVSLRHLQEHCTACQLCVAACPNGVLRPSGDGVSFMQPRSSYERGYCRPECTRCSDVCPTGAIIPLDGAAKSSIQIGHAVWVKENCVVITDGVSCGNCARHCPAGAITMVPVDAADDSSLKIPAVNTERCIGCGACENLCPARPFSAIYVEGHEVHRTI